MVWQFFKFMKGVYLETLIIQIEVFEPKKLLCK